MKQLQENVRAQTNDKMKSHGPSQRTSDMAGYVLSPLFRAREEARAFHHRSNPFYSHPTDKSTHSGFISFLKLNAVYFFFYSVSKFH